MTLRDQPSPHADSQVPQVASGFGITIHRDGCKVQVTLTAQNEYDSIELFDSLVEGARQGSISLGATIARQPAG
jgi:hypothetical protein